jgi:hypothetical protein
MNYYAMQYQNQNFDLSVEDIEEFEDGFSTFLEGRIEEWVQFYEFWMDIERKIPVYIVKFEDLIRNPIDTLRKIL